MPHFVHPCICLWAFGFHLLAIVNSADINTVYKYPSESLLSILSCVYLEVKLLGHMVTPHLTF